MRCAVVVPVGPGHEDLALEARRSVMDAWEIRHPQWTDLSVDLVDDSHGLKGRCAARNEGIARAADADWIFLMDADDAMAPGAFTIEMPDDADAVFGWISFFYRKSRRYGALLDYVQGEGRGRSWESLMAHGSFGTLSVGGFFRAGPLRAHPFREDLDYGEDWEFFLSFLARHPWIKLEVPLVRIGNHHPSAGGPRGKPDRKGWQGADLPFFAYWSKRGRVPLTDEERKRDYWR